jgi:hypothetical protein
VALTWISSSTWKKTLSLIESVGVTGDVGVVVDDVEFVSVVIGAVVVVLGAVVSAVVSAVVVVVVAVAGVVVVVVAAAG